MEKPKTYLFIDESGDASFYAKKNQLLIGEDGFQPLLLLGMIQIESKKEIFDAILKLQNDIKSDNLYNTLKCVNDPKGWYFHARNDQLEIRTKFVELIRTFDQIKSFVVIGRKRLDVFQKKHNKSESEFYFDMVYHLLKDRLTDEKVFYQILLSSRSGSSTEKLKNAIEKAIAKDNLKRDIPLQISFDCRTVPSDKTPELSIVDYLLWALQRYILSGDNRFYNALKDKFDLIIDLYDFEKINNNESRYYQKDENIFEIEKASAYRRDGYINKKSNL
jgi:hypothetical protein